MVVSVIVPVVFSVVVSVVVHHHYRNHHHHYRLISKEIDKNHIQDEKTLLILEDGILVFSIPAPESGLVSSSLL